MAYKTIGTFVSQKMRREDACGQSAEQAKGQRLCSPPPPPPTAAGTMPGPMDIDKMVHRPCQEVMPSNIGAVPAG